MEESERTPHQLKGGCYLKVVTNLIASALRIGLSSTFEDCSSGSTWRGGGEGGVVRGTGGEGCPQSSPPGPYFTQTYEGTCPPYLPPHTRTSAHQHTTARESAPSPRPLPHTKNMYLCREEFVDVDPLVGGRGTLCP